MSQTKTGRTTSLRAAKLRKWVRKTYGGMPENRKLSHDSTLTTIAAALVATEALGFHVTPNRVARELDRQGIPFRRTKADPPPPVWGNTELVRARQDHLEERIRALEVRILGRAKAGFSPRSRKDLKKVLNGAGGVPG